MRKIFFFILAGLPGLLSAQAHTVTVTNGYGSGTYTAGDTVHIWCIAYDSTRTFDTWSGDISLLDDPREWHTRFVMPAADVNLAAITRTMPAYTLYYEQIEGVNNLKNVYWYFPPGMKGVLYILHGTSGSTEGWVNTTENRSFVNAAIADTFGIIITEAEEITLHTDLNSDGKLRWNSTPFDSVTNVDYANIKAITDTFILRGAMNYSTPRFSFGMSNGGSFSSALSYLYHYKAGISYCASGPDLVFSVTAVPFAFRMALYDDNDEVGPQGNYEAWQHDSTLESRGICHDYRIHDRQPLYPERFARIPGVSVSLSQSIFNELLSNGQLDAGHYALNSDTIYAHIVAQPLSYPVTISQPTRILLELSNQIAAANAQHQFYSDWNYASLRFFNRLCSPDLSGVHEISSYTPAPVIYPNPASSIVCINGLETTADSEICIYNTMGIQVMLIKNGTTADVNNLPAGIYFLQIKQKGYTWKYKLVRSRNG